MTLNGEDTKSVTIVKEKGQKWVVEFNGRISRRDLNQLRRLLPVEYARKARRKQLKRLQAERAEKLLLTDKEVTMVAQGTVIPVTVKTSVIKSFLGKKANPNDTV